MFIRSFITLCLSIVWTSCATTSKSAHDSSGLASDGDVDLIQGNYRDALKNYRDALNVDPRDPSIHRRIGIALVKIGNYADAIKHLSRAEKIMSQDFEVHFYRAEAKRALGNFHDALQSYRQALSIDGNELRALKGLSWTYYQMNYLNEALTTITTARSDAPNDGQSAIIHARILLALGRNKEALKVSRQAKNVGEAAYLPFFLSVEGDSLLAANDCTTAAKVYREALKLQPLLPGALIGSAECMLKDGDPKLAIEYIQRAIRIKPNLAEGYKLLSQYYSDSDPQKAERYRQRYKSLSLHANRQTL